jgi:VanZ family protein
MLNLARWVPSVIWMGVIYYLSSRTGNELQGMFPFLNSFNFGHLIAYFVLSLLFYWGLKPFKERSKMDIRFISIGLAFLYGLTDEFHQAFVPGRFPDVSDIINDVVGAAAAMVLVTVYNRRANKNTNKY